MGFTRRQLQLNAPGTKVLQRQIAETIGSRDSTRQNLTNLLLHGHAALCGANPQALIHIAVDPSNTQVWHVV